LDAAVGKALGVRLPYATLLIGAVVAAILIGGCSASVCAGSGCGSGKIDVTKAESATKTYVAQATGAEVKSVSCPAGVPLKKGTTFTCTATESNGTIASVVGTETDAKGSVHLSPPTFPDAGGTIDTAKAESVTKTLVEKLTGAAVKSVSCPTAVALKKGAAFTCIATGGDGTTAPVTVTQTSGTGDVHISAPTLLHTGEAAKLIASGLESKLKFSVVVKCPDLVSAHKGTTLTCEAAHPGQTPEKVLVTVTDGKGDIDYRVQ
jgi:DUF4097 and DUF4098 domain-containing protein YvlB